MVAKAEREGREAEGQTVDEAVLEGRYSSMLMKAKRNCSMRLTAMSLAEPEESPVNMVNRGKVEKAAVAVRPWCGRILRYCQDRTRLI